MIGLFKILEAPPKEDKFIFVSPALAEKTHRNRFVHCRLLSVV